RAWGATRPRVAPTSAGRPWGLSCPRSARQPPRTPRLFFQVAYVRPLKIVGGRTPATSAGRRAGLGWVRCSTGKAQDQARRRAQRKKSKPPREVAKRFALRPPRAQYSGGGSRAPRRCPLARAAP